MTLTLLPALILAAAAAATPAPTPRASVIPQAVNAPKPPDTTPKEMAGAPSSAPQHIGSIGSRVKLNRAKASTIFVQKSIPEPPPVPTAAPPDPGAKATAAPAAAAAPKTNGDESAEVAWRQRFRDIRDRLATAQAELAEAERANPHVYNMHGHLLVEAETARNAAIAPYRARVEGLRADLDRLPEDCRKAGCQPGWIRD